MLGNFQADHPVEAPPKIEWLLEILHTHEARIYARAGFARAGEVLHISRTVAGPLRSNSKSQTPGVSPEDAAGQDVAGV